MAAILPLAILGVSFQAKGIWSLTGLGAATIASLMIAYPPPLLVRIVFLSQDLTFEMNKEGIDSFIKSLFSDGECEWSCHSYQMGHRHEGISKSSIHVWQSTLTWFFSHMKTD